DGRSVITTYTVTSVADPTKSCTTSGTRNCAVNNLPTGIHRLKVTATNAVGVSGASPPSTPVPVPTVSLARGTVGALVVGRFTRDYAFELPEGAASQTERLTMSISDVSGRIVWEKTVRPSAGVRAVAWDGRVAGGLRAPTGMYVARVR